MLAFVSAKTKCAVCAAGFIACVQRADKHNCLYIHNVYSFKSSIILFELKVIPEKIEFDGKKCRTTRINDVLRYILQIDKELDENKKGQISKNMSLSRVVESPRIELGSKQATKVLSTRLVFI